MARYIIERQYLVPVFENILVEASSIEAACREAIDARVRPWGDDAQLCFDDTRPTRVTYAVQLPDGFEPQLQLGNGDDCETLSSLIFCSELDELPIPKEFSQVRETPERGAGFI